MKRIVIDARLVLPEAWVDDGFGGRELRKEPPKLRLLNEESLLRHAGHPLLKAIPPGKPIRITDSVGRITEETFERGGYTFRFHKAGKGLPILTVTGPAMPMPFHMVVRNHADAVRRAPDVAAVLARGEVPDEGVYRREDDAALRVRYGAAPA